MGGRHCIECKEKIEDKKKNRIPSQPRPWVEGSAAAGRRGAGVMGGSLVGRGRRDGREGVRDPSRRPPRAALDRWAGHARRGKPVAAEGRR